MNTALMVTQEEFIQAAPEKVWQVMTSAEGIRQWLGPSLYEPRQGAPITFDVRHDGKQYRMFGEVVTFDPPRELAFTWTEQEIGDEPWPVLTLTLTPEGSGTRVRLVHSGFERLPANIAQAQVDSYVAGWAVLVELKTLVENA